MAIAYFGLNRGQSGRSSAAGTSPVLENATTTVSADVQVSIDLTKGLTKSEMYQMIERLQEWIMENRSKFLAD